MPQCCTKDHEAIHKVLSVRGEQPDDNGSFMATVHKTATSLRSAVTGLDRDALSPFIDGEEQIVEKYDAAIDEESSDVSTREMLEEQRAELLAKVGEMKALKSST